MPAVFQRPLLATEHTDFDSGAEALALALAQRAGLPLACVLPLLSNPEFESQAPALAARAERQAAEALDALRRQAEALHVRLDPGVRRGPELYEEIVAQARELGSDLLVTRRRGRRGFLANLLLGEMVCNVVTHAPCHVLIVPRAARLWQRRVLVAAEPTAQGRQLLALATAVAADAQLPLQVVSVRELAPRAAHEEFLAAALAQAAQAGVTAAGEVLEGKPSAAILQAAQACGADLLVVGSRGDRQIGRALLGGVAQKVIGLSPHAVLVARLD